MDEFELRFERRYIRSVILRPLDQIIAFMKDKEFYNWTLLLNGKNVTKQYEDIFDEDSK